MITVSLKQFISQGDFGPMAAGITATALEAVFGAPEATGGQSRKHPRPVIWKYGDVEFIFDRPSGLLRLIHVDQFTASYGHPQGWGELDVEPWIIQEGLSLEKFSAAVKELGVGYTVRDEKHYNQEVIVIESGVEVGFVKVKEMYSPPVGLAWLSRAYEIA